MVKLVYLHNQYIFGQLVVHAFARFYKLNILAYSFLFLAETLLLVLQKVSKFLFKLVNFALKGGQIN